MGLNEDLRREQAAWRPYSKPRGRAFIDFLGTDSEDRLHVIETKVGGDKMLILQGLDYWIWATANRAKLAKLCGLQTSTPDVVIHFIVAKGKNGKIPGPYTERQSHSLDHIVDQRF